jgi:hypothetical protein
LLSGKLNVYRYAVKWEECMRLVIQDERYGSLKTLGGALHVESS